MSNLQMVDNQLLTRDILFFGRNQPFECLAILVRHLKRWLSNRILSKRPGKPLKTNMTSWKIIHE